MSLDEIRLILKDDIEQLLFEMEVKGLVKQARGLFMPGGVKVVKGTLRKK